MKFLSYLMLICLILGSCSSETTEQEDFTVNVRLSADPGRLNPIVGTPTTQATAINGLIFLPLAHYDPITFELSPLLVKEVPEAIEGEDGSITYEYEIVEEAVWDDGSPVTGEDYEFTLKAALNPGVDAAAWRGILSDVRNVNVDEENPKKFSVTLDQYFHIAKEAFCTFEIVPSHVYDPTNALSSYEISDIKGAADTDSTLSRFAEEFNSIKYTQEIVQGCGPYRLKAWELDQYIVLEKKENYWGEAYPDRTLLHNNPQEINYRIIADENAAITLLKDGSIDLMLVADATMFDNLKSSANFEEKFNVETPSMSRFYYIGLNNRKPELSDKDVRRALAHLLDVDNIIQTLDNGYGNRLAGPIFPNSPVYEESLKPIEYNPEKAIEILEQEGWKDSNGNGIRDKVIDGELVELEVDYLASQSPLGQKVGLLFKDNAKEAGVEVTMEIKEGRAMQEAIFDHQYEASASAAGLSLAPYDPYQRWHSDNSPVRKGNIAGYVNERNDELIEIIRISKDPKERTAAYKEFQKLLYEEQPVIFLYAPTQKFVISKKFDGLFSEKRPGYFVGSFELAD
ncbi:ABC transporter substrate-binding protein [Portibacter marinus]|uniref:ABC transporter substrate-binding protein n=1 Tax=Portibacter marinus TaxID=2898660 RepID=UPI001F2718D8|nr:ABC transporter substrate-binding protein [Portibacter marinus]